LCLFHSVLWVVSVSGLHVLGECDL
jgi:hypothetical protein